MAYIRGYHVPLPPAKDILCVYIIIIIRPLYIYICTCTQVCEHQKIDPARIKRALDINFSAKYNYIYIRVVYMSSVSKAASPYTPNSCYI